MNTSIDQLRIINSPDLMKGLCRLGESILQEIRIHIEQDIHTIFDCSESFQNLTLNHLFNDSIQHKLACCSKLGPYVSDYLVNFTLHRIVSLYLAKAFSDLSLKREFKFIKNLLADIKLFQNIVQSLYPIPLSEFYIDTLLNFYSLFESDNYDELLKGLLKLNVFLKSNLGKFDKKPKCFVIY